MNIKQVLASGIINIGGLLSKKATVSLIKETNAVRLVPFKWLAEYLKHHASLRGVVQYVDVGTNDGLEMGQLLNSVGPFKSVHAIEPNPIIVEQLRNRFPSVCLHQLALGNCDTEAKLIVPLDNNGEPITEAATIVTDLSHSFEKTSSWRVAIRHPQSVDIDWSLPSLIKIDAEGAELMIIDALIPLLNKNSIICVEDHWAIMDVSEQKEYKKSLTSLISNLKSKGILFTKWM